MFTVMISKRRVRCDLTKDLSVRSDKESYLLPHFPEEKNLQWQCIVEAGLKIETFCTWSG